MFWNHSHALIWLSNFFFRRPKTPSPTSPTLCDPVSRSDPRTAVLASLGHLVRFYTTHQKMCCISGWSGFWLTWYATLTTRSHERSTSCQVHGLNEANSDYFAPCLWYKKIFDYILSEEKLWFYVWQRQCSRVRKYSDLCVQAPVKSTCKGSLQFIRKWTLALKNHKHCSFINISFGWDPVMIVSICWLRINEMSKYIPFCE